MAKHIGLVWTVVTPRITHLLSPWKPFVRNPFPSAGLQASARQLRRAIVSVPEWRDDAERIASRTPRVRVALRQLKGWYRTLDQLLERKVEIEYALFITLRDLFSLKVDMV